MRAPLRPLAIVLVLLLVGPGAGSVLAQGEPGAAAAEALPSGSVPLRELPPVHSETLGPGLDVQMAYVGPAPRGVVGLLEVRITAREEDATGIEVALDLPAEVLAVDLATEEIGDLAANESALVRFALVVRSEGVHAIRAEASGFPSMEGFQQGWLKVEGLAPATLMLDVRSDEPAFGLAEELVGIVPGADATDTANETPAASGRPWPADPYDDATPKIARVGAATAADAASASAATFTARMCWFFALPQEDGSTSWLRQRWYDYRVMADVPGADKVLATGVAGKDGCVVVAGLPRTVDGAATKAYFVARSCNAGLCVTGKAAPDGYAWRTPTKALGAESVLDWGNMGPASREYAGRIFARMNNAWTWYVNVALTPSTLLAPIDLRTPSQDYSGGTYYDGVHIYILVDGFRDVNEETVIHEYAHHFHYSLAPEWPEDAGGKHSLCDNYQKPGLAWTEGFAVFSAVRANFDLGAKGVPGSSGDTRQWGEDIETNSCGNGGNQNEFRVAMTLWDLTDGAADGKDDGWWNLPDVVFMVRACGGVSVSDFYDGDCGWRTAGRNMCVFLRSAYQNKYDLNRDPTALVVGPETADVWVGGTIALRGSGEDHDPVGTGNCPLRVEFWASEDAQSCTSGTLVGTDTQAPYDINVDTKVLTTGVAYYVCALALDGMDWGKDRSGARYLIDNLPPAIAVDDDANAAGWWTFPALVGAACTDAHSGLSTGLTWPIKQTRLDNGSWSEDNSFWVESNGRHWGEFRCYDRVGNVGLAGVHIRVDTSEPTTALSTSPGDFHRDQVTVTGACSDAASGSGCKLMRYWMGAAGAQTFSAPVVITSGVHTFNAYSIDVAGNAGPTVTRRVGIDRTPPVAWVNNSTSTESLSLPGWHWSEPEITVECSDALAGKDHIELSINGVAAGQYTRPFLLPLQGEVNVTATCHDKAGNTVNVTRIVKVDTRAPEADHALNGTQGAGGWYRSNVTVQAICSDSGSGVRRVDHRLSNGTWTQMPVGDPRATLDFHGTRWLEVRCSDWIGHNGLAEPATVRIDKLPPTSTASVSPAPVANGAIFVTLWCSDPVGGSGCARIRYRVDGGAWTDYAGPIRVADEGAHVIEHVATDLAGNDGPVMERSVRVDLTPPTLERALNGTLGEAGWYVSSVVLTLTCADGGSGLSASQYRLSNGTWLSASSPVTFSFASQRWVEVRCVDLAGNVRAEAFNVKIDPFAPTLTVTAGALGWTNASSVSIFATCDDGATGSGCTVVRYRRAGGEWFQYTGAIAQVDEGEMTYELDARDAAGHWSASVLRTIRIDRTAPVATLTLSPSTPASGWYAENVTVSLSCAEEASGMAAFRTQIVGGNEVAYTAPVVFTEDGTREIVGRCRDQAGNVGSASAIVRIDRSPPGVLVFSVSVANSLLIASWNATEVTHGLDRVDVEEQDLYTGEWFHSGCGGPQSGTSAEGSCLFGASPGMNRCFRAILRDVYGNMVTSPTECGMGTYWD